MKRLLLIGDHSSSLTRERMQVALVSEFEVHCFCRNGGKLEGAVNYSLRLPAGIVHLLEPFYMILLLLRIRPSVVHVFWANHCLTNYVLGLYKNVIVTVMGGDIMEDQAYNGLRKIWIKFLLKRAAVITSKSSYMDEAVRKITGKPCKRITWGVDLNLYNSMRDTDKLRKSLELHDETVVFFSPRGFQEIYRQFLIVREFTEFVNNSDLKNKSTILILPEYHVNNSILTKVKSFVVEQKMEEYIKFIPPIKRSEMPEYLKLADVFISMARSDGMPQTLYEAMACGAVPVCGSIPQLNEIIEHKKNGWIVSENQKLSEVLKEVYSERKLRESIRQVNYDKVRLIADKQCESEKIIKLYEELAG